MSIPSSRGLAVERLEDRITPATVSVHADQTVRTLTDQVFGANLPSYDSILTQNQGDATDARPDPGSVGLLTAAGMRLLRLSNGSGADEWHFAQEGGGLNFPTGAGALANTAAAVGADAILTVNYGTGTPQEAAAYLAYLNGDPNSNLVIPGWGTVGQWARLRGQQPLAADDGMNHLRADHVAPYGFHYFEVGNEVYFGAWQGGVSADPNAYALFAAQFAALARQIDPNVKVGVDVANPFERDASWNDPMLADCAADGFTPDFVDDHLYIYDGHNETPLTDAQLLTQTVSDPNSSMPIHADSPRNWAGRAAAHRARLDAHFGAAAATIQILAGEFNSDADGSTRQTTALTNGLLLADAIGTIIQTEYQGLMVWNFRNSYGPPTSPENGITGWRTGADEGMVGTPSNGFGPPATGPYVPYPTYFAEQLASKLGVSGDAVVPVDTDGNPAFSAYAVRRENGHLSLLLINKDPAAANAATVTLTGFTPAAAADLWRYGQAEDDAQRDTADGSASLTHVSIGLAGGTFSVTLPAYSMTLLDVAAGPGAPPPPPPVAVASSRELAVGGANGSAAIFIPAAGGPYVTTPAATMTPFAGFSGSVRTASADVDGDHNADTIVVTGPGTPIRVAVISGADNSTVLVPSFDPFGGNFSGGGFVAASDIDGDGKAEFVVTPDQGGGPRVSIFSLVNGTAAVKANFLGIDDSNFRGGCRAALGDVNKDGTPDLAVSAGFLGGPRTALFDGKTVFATPTRLVGDFFAFPGSDATTLRNGVFVAAGDVDGDGFADLIFGGGPGGAPRVFVLSGALVSTGNVAGAQANPIANFFVAGNSADRGGVRLAVKNADGDNKADVIAGSGEGSPANVRIYLGKNFTTTGEPSTFQDISVFGGSVLPGGVFVG